MVDKEEANDGVRKKWVLANEIKLNWHFLLLKFLGAGRHHEFKSH